MVALDKLKLDRRSQIVRCSIVGHADEFNEINEMKSQGSVWQQIEDNDAS